jgi:hypothetical protein
MNRTEPQSYQEFESLPARVFGILRSPRAVFRHMTLRPRWADVMIVGLAATLVCGIALLQTSVGRQALVDQLERTAFAFGQPVDDAQYARFEELSEQGVRYAAVRAIASGPMIAFGAAAILFGIFSAALGGQATYRQTLAITAHAGVVLALRDVIAAPVNYVRETLASPATLTMFVPMLDEASPAARFFGAIDLFVVWWVVLVAVGVSVLYQRPLRATALAFVGAYVAAAVLLAIAMAVAGGTS